MESKIVITPIEVTAGGKTFKIMPFGFGQLPHVAGKLAGLLAVMPALQAGSFVAVADVIAEGGDNLMDVVALAINQPRSFLNNLQDIDEGEALVAAVMAANRDTFEKKVLPKLMLKLATPRVVEGLRKAATYLEERSLSTPPLES